MARIELRGLRKEFGATVAVDSLDLVIDDGEFLVLVGPSGCGKTTTLRMLAGFEDPSRGEILIDGRVVNDLEPRERDIGMVFQSHALFPHKRVYENIEFGLRMKKVPPEERRRLVEQVAALVHITPLLDKMPAQCSGGESQRVALARTLVTQPSVFLLDEPLSSLDAKLRRELRAEVDRLHAELEKTFVYVTHDQEEAMTLADRIIVMRDGNIEQVGSPMEIYDDPRNVFVADFFGSPSMNLIEGEVIAENGSPRFRSPRLSVDVPPRFADRLSGKVTFGIRPEHVRVGAVNGMVNDVVDLVEPMGKETLLYFEAEAKRPLVAVVEGKQGAELTNGQPVGLTFPEDRIYFFDRHGTRIH